MGGTQIDFGQSDLKSFKDGVSAGTIHFDENAVREAAQLYDHLVLEIRGMRDKVDTVAHTQGFGGFASALELQQGFSNKLTDGVALLNKFIDGALQLKEAYLRAGGLLTEADQCNADRMKILANSPHLDGMS